jgi:hypothetical protein
MYVWRVGSYGGAHGPPLDFPKAPHDHISPPPPQALEPTNSRLILQGKWRARRLDPRGGNEPFPRQTRGAKEARSKEG